MKRLALIVVLCSLTGLVPAQDFSFLIEPTSAYRLEPRLRPIENDWADVKICMDTIFPDEEIRIVEGMMDAALQCHAIDVGIYNFLVAKDSQRTAEATKSKARFIADSKSTFKIDKKYVGIFEQLNLETKLDFFEACRNLCQRLQQALEDES